VQQPSDDVFGYLREHDGQQVVVLLNFQRDRRAAAVPDGMWKPLVATGASLPNPLGGPLELGGHAVVIAKRQ
jgi:hypothetical protein